MVGGGNQYYIFPKHVSYIIILEDIMKHIYIHTVHVYFLIGKLNLCSEPTCG